MELKEAEIADKQEAIESLQKKVGSLKNEIVDKETAIEELKQ